MAQHGSQAATTIDALAEKEATHFLQLADLRLSTIPLAQILRIE